MMRPSTYSTLVLVLAAAIIFVAPVFPQHLHRVLYSVLFALVIAATALSMDRGRRVMVRLAVVSIVCVSVAGALNLAILMVVSRTVIFLFFIRVVIGLITQIAKRRQVTARVIMESISGYLLLGLVFSLIVTVVEALSPGAFSFPVADPQVGVAYRQSDFIYYSFVTYTTLGYGEIVPMTAYAKSLAVLMSVSGPIYLTVIVAMLVGKFLSQPQQDGGDGQSDHPRK